MDIDNKCEYFHNMDIDNKCEYFHNMDIDNKCEYFHNMDIDNKCEYFLALLRMKTVEICMPNNTQSSRRSQKEFIFILNRSQVQT